MFGIKPHFNFNRPKGLVMDYDCNSYDNDVISCDSDKIKSLLILIKYLSHLNISQGASVGLIFTLRKIWCSLVLF